VDRYATSSKNTSRSKPKLTPAQELLRIHLNELGQGCDYEVRFCDRKWRFDIALPLHRLAIEISGGNWTGGHRRGQAQENEYEKLNLAQMMGWRVLQFTNRQVLTGQAKEFLRTWLAGVSS
jgi:very-short-patch-repair endonuclease